jgi:AcrR family transcriptional regulator
VSSTTVATARTDVSAMHERIVEAAIELTSTSGWSGVTMARLADRVGVSRQTVYNEIGSKSELAEAMVLTELGHFLVVVNAAFDAHPNDLIAAMRGAVRGVLERAETSAFFRSIVSATQGVDTELLPALTTRSETVVDGAKAVVRGRLEPFAIITTPSELEAVTDMVVRVVLSHAVQPSASPEKTAADLAWLVGRALAGGSKG